MGGDDHILVHVNYRLRYLGSNHDCDFFSIYLLPVDLHNNLLAAECAFDALLAMTNPPSFRPLDLIDRIWFRRPLRKLLECGQPAHELFTIAWAVFWWLAIPSPLGTWSATRSPFSKCNV